METEYKDAIDFLFSQLPMFSRVGAPAYKPGLDTSLQLSKYFGDPHKEFKSIHIGGTNGKGSTSHMLASILQSHGYKVGLYTSPHLVDFRERIRINGEMISKENVVKFVDRWRKCGYEGKPSFFELTMIMAFNWFAEEKIDYAVIEVGMGGRLDSTNIITPILSVITNISHDHNQFLGETLIDIAGEKAGIIKEGIPVVIGETQPEVEEIFLSKAKEKGSGIVFADKFVSEELESLAVNIPLHGDYQKKNIKTVLAAIEEIRKRGIKISDDDIKNGIEKVCDNTGLMGRWMIFKGGSKLGKDLTVIADTGHNISGLTYNFNQLDRLQKEKEGGRLRIVIGFVADKAIDKILTLLPRDAEYYITNAQIPRALPALELKKLFEKAGINGRVFHNVGEAYDMAQKEASEKDIIFIGGSTFIVADFLKMN